MIGFSITKAQDQVTPSILGIIRAIGNQGRRRLLLSAGQKFLEMTKSNFGNSGKYRDKSWAPLKKGGAAKAYAKGGVVSSQEKELGRNLARVANQGSKK